MARRAKRTWKTEREFWRLLRADTKAAAVRRAAADRDFKRIFPEGRDESIKDFFEYMIEQFNEGSRSRTARHIGQFHPDAIPLILKYGMDYVPQAFQAGIQKEKLQPLPGKCFFNSCFMMRGVREGHPTSPIIYVEGIVMGAVVTPMLHSWNAVEGTNYAWDWSHYATSPWSCYFGVPFTYDEHEFIMRAAYGEERTCSLFDRDQFERHKEPLREVLSRRVKERSPAA